jgi:hypothetical protein
MRRLILLGMAAVALAGAQPKPDQKEFNLMLDQIRAAIRAEDWPEASRIAMRLNAALLNLRARSQASPLLELQHLEMLAGNNSMTRNPLLPRMARAAFAAGEWARADGLANEALEAAKHGVFWWTGDAIHQGNIILGRLALRESKLEAAKRFLLAAGRTPGSSSLDGLGPNMALAKDLLDGGETATVLAYLESCGQFWNGNRGKLAEWIALVRAGLTPDFGPNLGY